MILEQLRADAEHLMPDIAPPMYNRKPVRWLIDTALAQACFEATGSPVVRAVILFLSAWDPAAHPETQEIVSGDMVTFRVGDTLPIDLPEVRAFWARQSRPAGGQMECLVCGALGAVEASMPLPLKGVPDGQPSGTALVSANANAFGSYGLERAQTSSICKPCGGSTHKALNVLLAERKTHLRVGRLVYVFWTSAGDYSPLQDLDQPGPESVRQFIESHRTGQRASIEDEAAVPRAPRRLMAAWPTRSPVGSRTQAAVIESTVGSCTKHLLTLAPTGGAIATFEAANSVKPPPQVAYLHLQARTSGCLALIGSTRSFPSHTAAR